jgi:hypothetical protein
VRPGGAESTAPTRGSKWLGHDIHLVLLLVLLLILLLVLLEMHQL